MSKPDDPVAPASEDEVEDLGIFEPDPNLIAHAEGNKKWLRYFQEHARQSAAAAKAAARDNG